ncbi:putative transposase [Pseudogracilibacillus sp. SO30301A]|uniref:putative transposase n=1 Tax=Pseudogracilibacillus sp. SO30301A TaxID=3098291 RepID=UPI00300E33A3
MIEQLTLLDVDDIEKLSIKKANGKNTIYWYDHYALVSYLEDDDLSRRMAVVFLIQTKLGTYAEVASLLGYSKSNLFVIMRAYREQGMPGLLKKKTGPKDGKVTGEIQQYIFRTKNLTLNEVVKQVQEKYGITLSNWTVSAVKRGKLYQEQMHLFEDEMLESLFDLDDEEVESTQVEETSDIDQDINPDEDASTVQVLDTAEMVEDAKIETVLETGDTAIFQSEGATRSSRYAGGFLLLPFLQQIDPFGLFQGVREKEGIISENDMAKSYNLKDFMYTLLFLLWFRFSSVEDFKFAQPKDFGVLIGKERAPSVKTLRRNFPAVLDGDIISDWMLELVRQYIKLDVIQLGTLYFDGHKIPYYGHVNLPKGYLSSKRFPAKLIEQVFANDRSGRPIFLRVHDTSQSFRDTIVSMIKDAKTLWEENEKGKRSPLIVAFDRELYDTALFRELDQMNVMYITWRKFDRPVSVDKLTEIIWEAGTDSAESIQESSVKYRFWRRGITVQGYRTEAISFLYETKAKKDPNRSPSTLLTNAARFNKSEIFSDFKMPSTGEIIDILCQRWRQENYFRYSKLGERLDYNPEYRTNERQETRNRANPEIKEIKKSIQKLKKEIDKLNDKVASRITKRKKKDKALEDILEQKSMKKLVQEKEQNEQQLQKMSKKAKELPERVPVEDNDMPSLESELHRKLFLDVLRIVMHNAEQMLLDVFKRCYSDPRDIRKVLRGIATQGGTVTEYHDRMVVELTALPIPEHRRATESLFCELNKRRYVMENNGKTIYFKIKNSPS